MIDNNKKIMNIKIYNYHYKTIAYFSKLIIFIVA